MSALRPDFDLDTFRGLRVAGVDEAGRGPLAGPVLVAAVILPEQHTIEGLDDSKQLTARHRESLFPEIQSRAEHFCIVAVEAEEIDRVNILQATLLGMQRAVKGLALEPEVTIVDGNRAPQLPGKVHTAIKGDSWVPAISAASILAKVAHDRIMLDWHEKYPQYGFNRNMGYPTPEHLECLLQHGPCPIHRMSFAPVQKARSKELF